MKKNTKTKSEPKSGRAGLLSEHDRIEQRLARLRAEATASDEINTKTIEKATAAYTTAANKAQAAFDAAITKAQKALSDATAKASKVNHNERDAIAAKNGPLKRRLQFLKSEVRREFVTCDAPLGVGSTIERREYIRPCRYPSDYNFYPDGGPWQNRSGGSWERRRVGEKMYMRRVAQ